jgi:hypothetical protein
MAGASFAAVRLARALIRTLLVMLRGGGPFGDRLALRQNAFGNSFPA